MAYILINTELDKEDETLEKLGCTPNIREIHTIYGVYDIIIRVECETKEKLKETVNDIKRLKNVRSTLLLICMRSPSHKTFGWYNSLFKGY